MKNILSQLLCMVLIIMGTTCYAQSKIDTVTIKTRITCDHCRDCETCGMKFEHDLYFGKGIKNSIYNPGDTTITVVYKTIKTSPDAIREAIARLGYDADHIPADPKAYRKLDDCCKKE